MVDEQSSSGAVNGPNGLRMEDWEKRQVEAHKLVYDLFKHMTTLCTGSIVLIATFHDKLAPNPGGIWLMQLALGGFMACLLFSVGGMGAAPLIMGANPCAPGEQVLTRQLRSSRVSGVGAVVSFCVAVIALSVFAVISL